MIVAEMFNFAKKLKEESVSGYRRLSGGDFYGLGTQVDWWSSTVDSSGAWDRAVDVHYTSVYRNSDARSYGFSVRCVGI